MEPSSKRTWNTEVREPWNKRIYYVLKAIDAHNELYFKTLDVWHLEQASYLRGYIDALKTWIKTTESTISPGSLEGLSSAEDT